MKNQIELINSYIERCDEVIERNDFYGARTLFLEILSVYETEIPNLLSGLYSEMGRARIEWEDSNRYWLQDMPALKAKLLNYALKLNTVNSSFSTQPRINIINNNTANATAQNTIDFETSIKVAQYNISQMESLSEHDTHEAIQKLNELLEIAKSKDSKKSKWSKIGAFFKWIAEKSVDLAVAFAPALMQVICSL